VKRVVKYGVKDDVKEVVRKRGYSCSLVFTTPRALTPLFTPPFTGFFTLLFTYKGVTTREVADDGGHFGQRMDMGTARDSDVLVIDTRRGRKASLVLFATCMVCVRGPWVPRGSVARQGSDCTFPP